MNANTVLKVKKLSAGYDNTPVLKDIDFMLYEGEFVSLIGKSGCGKSTLLLALAGFINSEGIRQIPPEIGIVFQNYAVFPWLTVKDIAFGLGHLQASERADAIAHYLALVGLEEQRDKYPTQLSGGQAQRVALARAFAPNPQVIFMDEPFGALDIFTRDKMQDWLNTIWEKENKTILFVTHNIEEALFLSDRILILDSGKILNEFSIPFGRPRIADLKYTQSFIDLKRIIGDELENSQQESKSGILNPIKGY